MINKKLTSTSILCELARLKSQQTFLEKTQNPIFKLEISDCAENAVEKDILFDIEKLQKIHQTEFPEHKSASRDQIKTVFENITHFETKMMNSDCMRNLHVINYRDQVIKMDNSLAELSKTISVRNELLRAKCKEIEATIPGHETILREIPKYIATKSKTIQEVIKKPISETACAEVKQFDRFLVNSGGHCGSWKDEEHNIYVKFKNKYKNNLDRVIECVNLILPDITPEEIRKHDKWYTEYLILKTKRKIAIDKWKISKSL